MSEPIIQMIKCGEIDTTNRLLPVDEDAMNAIATSMQNGAKKRLINPIIVRPAAHGFRLVAGAHRLAAAIKLGWAEIPAIVQNNLTEDEAKRWEIYENTRRRQIDALEDAEATTLLLRLDLKKRTPKLERAAQVTLAEITEELEKEDFFKETGIFFRCHPETVRRGVTRHKSLAHVWQDLKMVAGPKTGAALDRLRKKFSRREDIVIAHAIAEGCGLDAAMDAIQAQDRAEKTKSKSSISASQSLKNLEAAWKRCPEQKKREFLARHSEEITVLSVEVANA